LHKSKKYKEVETPTSKGFLLPISDAEKYYSIKNLLPEKEEEKIF